MRSAYLYRHLAKIEEGTPREKLFRSLADSAEKQANLWKKDGGAYRPDLRTAVVVVLLHMLGPERMLSVLAAMKVRGISVYSGHEMPGASGSKTFHERRHRAQGSGGNLRAAVFGANDGLLSNASLMLGVAGSFQGSASDLHAIVVSGIAGLLAGAFSMAAGEFVSMTSQRELYEYQIELEREELQEYPQEEAMELALIYEAKGIARDDAIRMGQAIVSDPQRALDTLAREELGLNPQDLGSPWGAALSSFVSFAVGALIPLLPLLLRFGLGSAIESTAAALFLLGCSLSLFTGRRAWVGGFRMLAIGALASGITYGVGVALGAAIR
jgi:VIT1/CCC1 family predicted Fe2+/Mn2+ transporter